MIERFIKVVKEHPVQFALLAFGSTALGYYSYGYKQARDEADRKM
jgi:hypothetical protein